MTSGRSRATALALTICSMLFVLSALLTAPQAAAIPPTFPAQVDTDDDVDVGVDVDGDGFYDPPTKLPATAAPTSTRWQPGLDYDQDGCYPVPAIGPDGRVARGINPLVFEFGHDECSEESDLANTNAYSRARCNSGWCAFVYALYFEGDWAESGHIHDWEHVVVWVRDGRAEYVAASAHGEYNIRGRNDVLWDGEHPKIVYHKDGSSTHAFRFANVNDDPPENERGTWQRPDLVGWEDFPRNLRDRLAGHDFRTATWGLPDSAFANELRKAKPDGITFDETSGGPPAEPTPAPPPLPGPGPQRVMIVGDSLTHGHQGDYTWRYRIWEFFRANGLSVDLVGPHRGTQPPPDPAPPAPPRMADAPPPDDGPQTSGGYRAEVEASGFDRDHFAVWGRQLAQNQTLIREQVARHQPDLLLVALGFNDLGWFVTGPEGTTQSMDTFIAEARAANPEVDLAIANVPQRTSLGSANPDLPVRTVDYNNRLAERIRGWSRPESEVHLVDIAADYDPSRDVYDGLHPNAYGEFKIARSFARTLVEDFGLVQPARLPVQPAYGSLERNLATPRGVSAASSDYGVTMLWDPVYDATHYEVQRRDVTAGGAWETVRAASNRYDTQWPFDGHTYALRVRAGYGDSTPSGWSAEVSAVARPRQSGQPTDVRVAPGPGSVTVSWTAPTGPNAELVQAYVVWVVDTTVPGSWPGLLGYPASSRSARIDGLTSGHSYVVGVQSWSAGGSFLSPSPSFVVG